MHRGGWSVHRRICTARAQACPEAFSRTCGASASDRCAAQVRPVLCREIPNNVYFGILLTYAATVSHTTPARPSSFTAMLALPVKNHRRPSFSAAAQIHSVFNQPSILGDLLPHLQNQVEDAEANQTIDPCYMLSSVSVKPFQFSVARNSFVALLDNTQVESCIDEFQKMQLQVFSLRHEARRKLPQVLKYASLHSHEDVCFLFHTHRRLPRVFGTTR